MRTIINRAALLAAGILLLLFAHAPALAQVTGTISFEEILPAAPDQTVTFEFFPVVGDPPIVVTASVGPAGAFSVAVPAGNYCLRVKTDRHLGTIVPADARSGAVAIAAPIPLRAGDVTGDDIVDLDDMDVLLDNFETVNAELDLNGDGVVSGSDVCILMGNFNLSGEALSTITGVIAFEGIVADAPAQTVTFEFWRNGELFLLTETVGPAGDFTLCLPAGDYFMSVEVDKYLRNVLVVNIPAGPVTLPGDIPLTVGDVVDDNVVDGFDADEMLVHIGTDSSDPDWNPQADLNGDGMVDNVDVTLLKINYTAEGEVLGLASVSGVLTFAEIDAAAPLQTVNFEFRPASTGNPFTVQARIDPATGVFTIPLVPPAPYTLHIKGRNWLAVNLIMDTSSGDVTDLTATLLPGDGNNNNIVEVGDLSLLIQAFDASPGDVNYNFCADFNADGIVDVDDLDRLVRYFDMSGDS